jgi:putative FmdB family regulatory protein
MPVYDYVCGACRHRFEVFHGLNEAGPHQCPLCEGPVTRAFAPPTILFKGSGWAKVDRRATSSPAKRGRGSGPVSDDRPAGPSTDAGGSADMTDRSSGTKDRASDAKDRSSGTKGGSSEAASSTPAAAPAD